MLSFKHTSTTGLALWDGYAVLAALLHPSSSTSPALPCHVLSCFVLPCLAFISSPHCLSFDFLAARSSQNVESFGITEMEERGIQGCVGF